MEALERAGRGISGARIVTADAPSRELGLPPMSRNIRLTAAVLIVLLGLGAVVAHALEYRGPERFSKDFALDYSSAKALLNGDDPYAPIEELVARHLDPPREILESNILPGANWHTPFKLLVTLPLSALPYRAAGVVWLVICATCVIAAAVILGRELGWSRGASTVMGVAFLAAPVTQIDLSAGNLNGPMLLLIVAAWRWFRRRADTAGGVALGAVTALKFFPALLALPLLAQRRFGAVAKAATITIALTLIGFAFLGGDHVRSFLEAGRGSEGFDHWDAAPANVAWWGIATRWLLPNGWVNGADVEPLGIALAGAGVAACLVGLLRPRAGLTGDPFIAGLPLMLIAWPISWIHYLVLLLPWVVLAGREVARRGGASLMLAYGLIAIVVVMGFPPGLPQPEQASTMQVAVGYQLPTLGLIGAVALDRFSFRQS